MINVNAVDIESIDYDYVPGERQSRRTWQITLRRPIEEGFMRIGMVIKLHSQDTPEHIIERDRYFRVDDIHGRVLLVTALNDLNLKSESNIRLTNINEHIYSTHPQAVNQHIYRNRPIVYGNGLHHKRMGRSLYTPRPMYQKSVKAYISFPY